MVHVYSVSTCLLIFTLICILIIQYERGRELADFVKYLNDKCGTQRLPGGKLSPEVHYMYMYGSMLLHKFVVYVYVYVDVQYMCIFCTVHTWT